MKEATGELSGTVITVVAIAAVAAIFTLILLPMMKRSIALTTACSSAAGGSYNQTLDNGDNISCDGTKCTYTVNGGGSSEKNCDDASTHK